MGIVQWAVADPKLDALAPSVTASQFRAMAYGGGSVSLATAASWLLILQVQERRLAPLLSAHGLRHTLPRAFQHAPIAELDELAFGTAVPYFRDSAQRTLARQPVLERARLLVGGRQRDRAGAIHRGLVRHLPAGMIEDYRALRAAGRSPRADHRCGCSTSSGLCAGVSLREAIAWMCAHLRLGATSAC